MSWYENRALDLLNDKDRQDGDERAAIVYALLAIADAVAAQEEQ